jgi:membrane peptidoglycan carboxypeptidase
VYLAALENGISPWDQRSDGPVDIDGWQPTNYGNRSFGTITLASALAHSVNTITAALAQEVGVTSVIDAAQRLGINSPMAANASIALGTSELTPLELTTAYAAIANGGYRVYPYFVTEVDDSQGHLLYKRETPAPKRVIAGHVDRDLVAMLYGVIQEGTGRSAMLPGHEAAGKTGTTQDYHDAWFVGFTTDYVCSVWLGNDDSSPMRNVTGGTLPASLWKSVMTYAEKDLPGKPLDKSAPEAPTDENGIITAESGSASVESANGEAATTDEEAGGEVSSEANASGNGSDSNSKENKSWWDWLFGRADNPQIRQPAQSGQAQEAHAHSDTSAPPAREHTDDNNGSAADSNSSGNSDEDNSGDNSDDTGDTPPTHQQHAWRTYSQQRALAAQSWRLRTRQAYAPTGRGYPPGSWQAYGWMQERSGDAQRMRDSEQQRAREYERQRAREYPPPQYAWRGEDSPDDAYGPPPPRYPRATRRSPRDEDDYGDEPGDYPER